jgi:NAD(P)-dependent dehydrogenase (short-subunit alcohol dehydrogenase family)
MAVALVTGTSTGIGFATAVAFARAGCEVYATMRHPDRAPELASTTAKDKLPIKILPMDVDDDASVAKAIAQIVAGGGRIDVLVNNARIDLKGPVEELPLFDFRRVMETNYFGALRCIQAVLPGMRARRSGYIINVTSVAGRFERSLAGPLRFLEMGIGSRERGAGAGSKVFRDPCLDHRTGHDRDSDFRQAARSSGEHPLSAGTPPECPLQCFAQAAHLAVPVADKIVEIVESKSWKLRHPVGRDADPLIAYRASMTDEQWVDLHALESDQEWAAVIKRDIGLDVVLESKP